MKKIIIFLIIFFIPISVIADSGKSTIVMDINSGRILYEKNINQKSLIASTTKIMTCIIVLENSNIESEVIVGEEVLSMYGTNIYIEVGEKMKIIDLLYGLMLRSGNDAAITLAVNTLGEDAFIKQMNKKALELGMNNTVFNNPHGLDDNDENYSNAYDMALLSRYAYQNPIYRKIISTKKYITKSSIKSYVWYNRMNLLTNYKNSVGGKNGYTPKAGKSLVSYAKKDDLTLMIVSLNDPYIYENHINLYNEYFDKYKNYKILDKDSFIADEYYIKKSFFYPLSDEEKNNVSTLIKINSNSGKGEIEIILNNKNVGTVKIYKKKQIKKEKNSLFNKILNLFS